MNAPCPFFEGLRTALSVGDRGVVGMVDALLSLCLEQTFQIEWQGDLLQARACSAASQDHIDIPLAKSIFRAVLARIAVLCNEQSQHSVSPYGGVGELSLPGDPGTILRVAFTNTSIEQRLAISCVCKGKSGVNGNHATREVERNT